VIELRAGEAHCTISPDDGGRIASLRIGGTPLLIERPHDGSDPDPMSWGCYAMAPWAGRVRNGRFTFDGVDHQLSINLAPHSIHGTVFTRSWHADLIADSTATLECTFGTTWPFGGFVTQRVELRPDSLLCELTITATHQAMPAQLGWHPWFTKPQSADLRFASMYERDVDGIPSGNIVAPTPGPWDDCFVQPLAPLELRYATDTAAIVVTISSDCDHWVIYDQPAHATCVEPQSGPPDGFNLLGAPRQAALAPAAHLAPGQHLQRTMQVSWRHERVGAAR
jgi:aldose 1-epimerase